MRKTLLYVVVAAAVSSLGVFAARQYAGSPSPSTPSKAFTEHITAYTSGTISNESGITIVLSGAPEKELDKRALARLFSFSPAIEGKVTWANDYTLTFKPNKPLPSNKKFKAKFRLGRIKEVASDLKTFAFQFQTLEQGLHVDVGGLQTPDPNAPASVELKGSLTTADWAANENIEQVLSATQRSKQLPIRWQHQPDSKSHTFTVADILRSEDKSDEVVIQWKGAPIGVSQAGERKVSLPELGKFQATGAYLSPTSNDCIIVNFSDPVDSKQELKGLLYLRNQSTGRQLGGRLVVESNLVYLYTKQPPKGDYKLVVERGVKNTLGRKLSQRFEKLIVRENIKPDVQLVGDGVILPSSDGLLFPFKAVSLSGVIVKIVQIPTNNVPQFLQINRLDQYKELKRVGRLIYKKKVALNKEVDLSDWNTFSLDLSQFIKVEPGAFYRVYLSFDRSQVLYPCTCTDKKSTDDTVATAHRGPAADPEMAYFDNPDDTSYSKDDYWYDESHGRFDYQGYRDEAGYSWDDRHNPCKPSYYMRGNHLVQRNVFASDLGIIAKRGDNKELFVAVSDLCTAQPLGKVELKAYNLQHQLVGQGKTSSEGMVKIVLEGEPFLLVAQQGKQIGYLQLNSSSTCSLSMFNVAGQRTQRGGLKGFIYGERGVWRPGDTVYLSFILEDKQHTLPANHPVIFELYNPHNQLHTKKIVTDGLHGFYSFAPTTGQDAPTGNWMAKVQVGGAVFTKTVKIETIKPNRLKAALDYDQTLLDKEGVLFGKLKAQWLHGALAKGLKADAQLRLFPTVTKFEGYANYTFDDPAKTFNSTEKEIFSGTLDQQGKGKLVVPMALNDTSPGMVKAAVNIRIFEKGGDFSIERTSIKYSPYSGYVGFHLPPGEGYNNALFSDQDNLISVVTVDERGRPVNRKKVKIEVFELKWRWWFDHSDADDFANYIQSNSTRCIHTGYVDTTDGKAIYNLNLDSKSWGRKYIRITDPVTNHSAGQVFYTDYTGYWQEQKKNTAGAEMLAFKTDKAKYQVGEQVTVDLPASKSGRALVSIESGSQILDTFWVPVTPQKHQFHFVATAAMAPNVYLHITYVQPHKERDNDLPIRLYGVQAIQVEDPNTHLQPVLTMPKTLAPETEIKIKV
ncbi:MAG: MG2 domain-containing protein, partial [Bacteroidota bacterium]